MKKLFVLLFFSLLFFSSTVFSLAQEASSSAQSVNSFEMFWPLSAGKTRADSLYFLKRLKENLRGAIIFRAANKADYKVFLGVKRTLEVEKLLNEDKLELADKTLDDAILDFGDAHKNYKVAKDEKAVSKVTEQIKNRLTNLSSFIIFLKSKNITDSSTNKLNVLEKEIIDFSSILE